MNSALWVFFGSLATVAVAAVLCARRQAYGAYLGYLALLTIVGMALAFFTLPPHYSSLSGAFNTLLIYVPLGAIYALLPGYFVLRGAGWKPVLLASVLATAVGIPSWFIYAISISCYFGHDCL